MRCSLYENLPFLFLPDLTTQQYITISTIVIIMKIPNGINTA